MALIGTTGYTDDGLVFIRFEGQQEEGGKPVQSVITLEPDYAQKLAKDILRSCDLAVKKGKKRIIADVGQPIVIPR